MRKAYLLVLSLFIIPRMLAAQPAQVIIVRHAEKDPITRQLSDQGEARAGALAFYLTQADYLLKFGLPFAIFASRAIPISDQVIPRTIETMKPLAERLQLPIHIPFNGFQVEEMAHFILNEKKYNGKNILICWNHKQIFNLLNAFGYQAPLNCPYPDCRFDLVFVLTFPPPPPLPSQPFPYATIFLQQLMFGDLTCETVCPDYPPSLPPIPCSCNDPVSCMQICDTPCNSVGLGGD